MPGFTRFDNPILEAVLTSSFTKRQLKIMLLVIRFSAGCQKGYALLRKKDFAYAGVSPYCITQELKKLVKRKAIRWEPEKDLVWINPNISDWAGDKSGDNLRRFFKIINKNLPKWQLALYQNSNLRLAKTARVSGGNSNKERIEKENKVRKKEDGFLKLLNDYYLKVSPLSEEEAFILQELSRSYPSRAMAEAIEQVAQGERRSFSHFLKTLDDLDNKTRPRAGDLRSLRASLNRRRKAPLKP
jgi:hypothetical protein